MLHKLRSRVEDERGFTLIELLVVILIIGILAAIAIPSFISQKDKAGDASAKSYVRNVQTAQETYFTDNGAYTTDFATLKTIEPTLADLPGTDDPTITVNGDSFVATVRSRDDVRFIITRATDGRTTRSCDTPNKGGCNANSKW